MANITVTRVYNSGIHSFFDSLVTMLFNYVSHNYILHANEAILNWYDTGDPSHFRRLRQPIEDMTFGLGFAVPDKDEQMIIPVHQFLGPVLSGEWPDTISFGSVTSSRTRRKGLLSSADSQKRLRAGIIGSAFLAYYESQKDTMESLFTSTTANWPPELNFARAVRNAAAHGGRIHFTNMNASSVTWRGITFGPSDNGREIFVGGGDMDIGSIILLFEDMDKTLYPDHWPKP